MSEVNQVSAVDTFNGDNKHLISCIKSLLSLDEKGALVPHGVGGHARTLLSSAAQRLAEFDRVTAERDAALGREDALREENLKVRDMHAKQSCVFCNDTGNLRSVNAELQQHLTAADERADVLTKALTDVREALGREYWDQYAGLDETRDILDTALNPAESAKDEHVCTGCGSRGWTANCKECVPY